MALHETVQHKTAQTIQPLTLTLTLTLILYWYSTEYSVVTLLSQCVLARLWYVMSLVSIVSSSRDDVSDGKRKPPTSAALTRLWFQAAESGPTTVPITVDPGTGQSGRSFWNITPYHYSVVFLPYSYSTTYSVLQLLYSIRSVCIDGVYGVGVLFTMLHCCMAASTAATARIEDRAQGGCSRLESVCTQCKHFDTYTNRSG